jgi:mono/diheme cytochrome c family protein
MVRKIFKWIGIVLGGLIGLLVLAFLALFIIGTVRWNQLHGKYDVPVETINVPNDQASIARGEHIVTIRLCRVCHLEDLRGQVVGVPVLLSFSVPNLTAGAGGVGSTNSAQDWVKAIRHGVGHDGRGLVLMPSRVFYSLSDDDVGAVIAYLKSLPPVDHEMPPTDLGPLGRVMLALGQLPPEIGPDVRAIDHSSPRPVAPETGVTADYGEYLARTCALCHGSNFNGQMVSEGGPEYLAPNLTPGGDLGSWSEEDFIATLRTGKTPRGHQLEEIMPWKYFGQMTDDEIKAVWLYLKSLPALEQGN